MINFKNKNILITGASGGIGNELVKKINKELKISNINSIEDIKND